MNNGMEELQRQLLQMLDELWKFSQQHSIRFFLVGGSALGEWRHHGFIPWDDDVDIAMMRPDFERLEELMKRQGNRIGEFIYSPVEEAIVPEAPIGHLYDSTHAENGYENTAKIDIHPIDGVPENRVMRSLQKIFSLVYYLTVYRLPVKNKGKMARIISKIILALFPNRLLDCFQRCSKRLIVHWDCNRSENICSLFGVAGYDREVMPRSFLEPLRKGDFVGRAFLVPNDSERYLQQLYGDYRKLPPEQERCPVHEIYKSYEQKDEKQD